MPYTVIVKWNDGERFEFHGIDRVTESDMTLRLETRKYKGLAYDSTMVHVASIPYTSMRMWIQTEE